MSLYQGTLIYRKVNGKVIVQGNEKGLLGQEQSTFSLCSGNFRSLYWDMGAKTREGAAPSWNMSFWSAFNDDLFTFGGYKDGNLFNTLHKLDTKTWRWCQLSPQNAEGAPMPKSGSGMISFNDSLGVFGGYGISHGSTEPGSFLKAKAIDGIGWTNEFHIYHLREGSKEIVGVNWHVHVMFVTWVRCFYVGVAQHSQPELGRFVGLLWGFSFGIILASVLVQLDLLWGCMAVTTMWFWCTIYCTLTGWYSVSFHFIVYTNIDFLPYFIVHPCCRCVEQPPHNRRKPSSMC